VVRWLRSPGWQATAVLLAVLVVAALHRESDGLWFQGDAPRHATTGLFWWDLLRAMPRDPVDYAVRYYARYPTIAPATYPPLVHIVEGLAFAAFGTSPYVARCTILVFAVVAGLYTMAWARTWIGPFAGWAGVFLAFVPGMVVWSNTVMLNVPATALGLASLYHFRRWLESGQTNHLAWTVGSVTAGLVTYYPSASVLPILAAWFLLRTRDLHFDRRARWMATGLLVALVPMTVALLLAPLHTSRHLPSIAFLSRPTTWTFYWMALPNVVGGLAPWLGMAGFAAALQIERWRVEVVYVAVWIVVLIAGPSLLPARDPRYILLVAPAFVLAVAIGIAASARYVPQMAPHYQVVALAASLALGLWSASRIRVPQVTGFREIAVFLRERAPTDAVLYDGDYDGLFGFYVRALDPRFERRVALANRLLYSYGPGASFEWTQTSTVASADDVVALVGSRSGCRWIAIEATPRPPLVLARRLLAEAVTRPGFEFVRSFPITGAGDRRVDLYRAVNDVQPVAAVDLRFPSLSDRQFLHVVPIAR
jgi:hypothetical protein